MIKIEWTHELCQRLRKMWDEDVMSASQMGIALGVSKNAIVGKAHRMGLKAKESPIKPVGEGRRVLPRVRRATKTTLPPMVVSNPTESASQDAPSVVYTRTAECCWPIGEPRKPGFRFCAEACAPGRHYCDVHHRIAFRPVGERRQSAA